MVERSPAYVAGLQQGDKVLGVNQISLEGADHHTAVSVFKQAGGQFSLHISRVIPMATTSASKNLNPSNQLQTSYSNGGIRNLAFDDRINLNNLPPQDNNFNNSSNNALNNETVNSARIQYATLIRDSRGIGITVAYDNSNNIIIESVTRPAYLADGKVRENDRLVSINGKEIKKLNMTIEDVNAILDSDNRFIRIVTERI